MQAGRSGNNKGWSTVHLHNSVDQAVTIAHTSPPPRPKHTQNNDLTRLCVELAVRCRDDLTHGSNHMLVGAHALHQGLRVSILVLGRQCEEQLHDLGGPRPPLAHDVNVQLLKRATHEERLPQDKGVAVALAGPEQVGCKHRPPVPRIHGKGAPGDFLVGAAFGLGRSSSPNAPAHRVDTLKKGSGGGSGVGRGQAGSRAAFSFQRGIFAHSRRKAHMATAP